MPPETALLLPLHRAGREAPIGFLVADASPRHRLDEEHHTFFELLAEQVARALTSARAHQEERQRAEALAALDRAKTDFFSDVSHEFRTPLTLMLGPQEELLHGETEGLSKDAREAVAVVYRNGLRAGVALPPDPAHVRPDRRSHTDGPVPDG